MSNPHPITKVKTQPAVALQNFDELPDSAMLRLSQLARNSKQPHKTALLQISVATVYRWIEDGRFPAPIKLSARAVVWRAGDVRAWLADPAAWAAANQKEVA